MKNLRKHILLILAILTLFSVTALSSSAVDVSNTSVDTIGNTFARKAYEVVISGEGFNLPKRKTMQLHAEVTGVSTQPSLTWTSSYETVATVDSNGKVKAKNVGRTLITAKANVAGRTIEGYYSINVVTGNSAIKSFLVNHQLASYQYSYVDDYFYTNDKDCWQDTFGYARIYDLAAPYVVLEYDYTRVFFNYEDRDFMIQLWKGQYGYVFYGAEIGIYTKDPSEKEVGMLTFYGKAEEEYWPEIEMTVYHQNLSGEWEREFTRERDKYWWCTGFKLGHLRDVEPADELRMVAEIKFKDTVMAKKFGMGLRDCGLTKVKKLSDLDNDTYYRKGSTVHVRWQNISEAENTMPIKVSAAALFGFNFLAILMAGLFMMGFGSLALIFIL